MVRPVNEKNPTAGPVMLSDLCRKIVDTIDTGVWLTTRDDRIVFANSKASALLNIPIDGLLGKRRTDVVGLEMSPTGPTEICYRAVGLRRVWLAFSGATELGDFHGEPVRLQSFRELSEENFDPQNPLSDAVELRESWRRLSLAMTASAIGLWDFDIKSGNVVSSPEYARILGYDPASFVESATLWEQRIHPEDLAFVQKSLGDYLEGKTSFFSIEFRMRTASSEYYWFLSMGSVVHRNGDGTPTRMIGTTQDITLRKNTEKAHFRLSATVESSPDFVGISNLDGSVVYINQAGRALLGLSPTQELEGLRFPQFLPPEEQEKFTNEVVPTLNSNGVWRGECLVQRLDGRTFVADMNRFVIRDKKTNKIEYFGNFLRDATERKRAEEELRLLNSRLEDRVREEVAKNRDKDHLLIQQSRLAAMGEMIGNIAHQWRQPINALGLILANLEDSWVQGSFSEEYLREQVLKAARLIDRMSNTIDDFRNFFRPSKAASEFSLYEVTKNSISLVQDALLYHNIALSLEGCPEVRVFGFPNEFSQALLNLIVNARDAILLKCTEGGRVWITVGTKGKDAVVTVEDNGGGIPVEVLDRIFDPYFTTREKGTGIGLYMTRTILEKNMKGRITVENTPLGARFSIYLPSVGPEELKMREWS